jgi:F-box/WD-40 domain protein MET30
MRGAQSIENLPPHDQTAVNTIWSLFSGSPSRRRLLILRGLLTIACPSQLTFLQDMLTLEMRLDPLIVLPREVSLKVFCYLDAISLGRAAQVSKVWKNMADDDLLWRTMCEQHIEKKCEKCGWGLPLLGERRRKARGAINALPAKVVEKASKASEARRLATPDTNATTPLVPRAGPVDLTSVVGTELVESRPSSPPHDHDHVHEHDHDHEHTHAPTPSTSSSMTLPSPMLIDSHGYVGRSAKRAKTESPAPSRSSTPAPGSPRPSRRSSTSIPPVPSTRPWKSVYCERLAIERNWRRGTCVATVLEGHTDSITCLQVAEDLPHPSFPVLMTGSWDRSVRIWNLETGKEVGILRGHTRGVRALQFDALKLVTGSMDSTLKIWNWRTGECVRTLRGHRDAVICLAYDKQLLVSGSADATIRVWDFGTGEVYTLRGHTEWVNSVAIWDSKAECDGKEAVIEGDMGAPTSDPEVAKKSCKGKFLFSASDDMTIRVWDLYKRTCVRVLTGHVAQVQSLRITTSEDQAPAFPTSALHPSTPSLPLASASSATTPNPRPTTTDPIDSAEVMEQNRHQVVAGNAYLGFFDAPTSDSTCAAPTPMGTAHALAASHPAVEPAALAYLDWEGDKKPCIISASLDNTIKVWDVEGGVCQRTLFGHIEGVWDVDVDKLRIVSASHDRTLKVSLILIAPFVRVLTR